MAGNKAREMIKLSSIASPGRQTVTVDSDTNEQTIPHGFGPQLPVIPPSLNNLNLPPNPFNLLATMVVPNSTTEVHDENYSPQSLEHSEPLPISTPPMNLRKIERWETPHTTTDDNTFYSDHELRRVYFVPSSPSPPPPPRKRKKKLSLGRSFPKRKGLLQHIGEACGQSLPEPKDIPGPSSTD